MIIYCTGDGTIDKRWHEALTPHHQSLVVATIERLMTTLPQHPDSILLLRVPLLPGLANTRDLKGIRERFPRARIVILSDRPDTAEGRAVLREGAYGYCNTHINTGLLLQVIQTVRAGEVWVGWALMQELIRALPDNSTEPETVETGHLTEREQEITRLVCDGNSNKQIARQLDISERTVKNHLHSIFQKTGVKDRLNLAIHLKGHETGHVH
ncbi:MAG: response regulator transcription factor [Candidatus Sedimenticola endophacoides]